MADLESGPVFSWARRTTTTEDAPATVFSTTVQDFLGAQTETTDINLKETLSSSLNDTVLITTESVDSTALLENVTVSSVETTTDHIMNTISDNVTAASTTTESSYEGNLAEIGDKTLYIVIGVILVALVLILIVLIIIYKRYKSRSSQVTRVYCVNDGNEGGGVIGIHRDASKEQRIVTFN